MGASGKLVIQLVLMQKVFKHTALTGRSHDCCLWETLSELFLPCPPPFTSTPPPKSQHHPFPDTVTVAEDEAMISVVPPPRSTAELPHRMLHWLLHS